MPYASPVDVFLILNRDGKVLLAQRSGTGYADGYWNLPSGKLEADEDLVTAVLRETCEEIGITLAPAEVRHAATVHYRSPEEQGRIGVFFVADAGALRPVNAEPHKCSAIAWFPPDAVPVNTVPYTTAGLTCWQNKAPFAVCGWSDSDSTPRRAQQNAHPGSAPANPTDRLSPQRSPTLRTTHAHRSAPPAQ